MENEFIFKLKRAIAFPVSLYDNQGIIVYNERDFALGYSTVPNPKEKMITINLLMYRLSDEVVTRVLNTFVITEQGFPSGGILNSEDIAIANAKAAKFVETIAALQESVLALSIEEAALAASGQDTTEIGAAILELNHQLDTARIGQQTLVIPQPELEYVNKYSDIINYFNKDGSITEAGIVWARTVPFMGVTLDAYLA